MRSWGNQSVTYATNSVFSDAAFSGGTPWGSRIPAVHAEAGMTPSGWALCHGPKVGYSDQPRVERAVVRRCECGKKLSRYNTGTDCFTCDEASA